MYKVVNKELMGSSSGRNSVVECQLPKLDVGGSNPLARFFSRLAGCCQRVLVTVINNCKGREKKVFFGGVAEWFKATVLKTVVP